MKNPWQASLTSRDRQGLDVESCHALEAFDILEARSGAGCSCVLYRIVSFVKHDHSLITERLGWPWESHVEEVVKGVLIHYG